MILALLACSGGAPADSADPFCDDAPVVTWESFGEGLIDEQCQPCHASTAPDRHGAPESVTFDDHDQVRALKGAILAASVGDMATMPPEIPLDEVDAYRLEVWLTCWEE